MNLAGIPRELRSAERWGLWRYEDRDGKQTKVPYSAVTGRRASSTELSDWTSFDVTAASFLRLRKHDGLGFVLGDGWAGVDLDKCRHPETGELMPWAADIVTRLDSHTEVSPSATGLKVFIRTSIGKLSRNRKKGFASHDGGSNGELEIYVAGRFFTVTGLRYGS